MSTSTNLSIRSMAEFVKKCYPRFYEEEIKEKIEDPTQLGIYLANKSLEKIKRELS